MDPRIDHVRPPYGPRPVSQRRDRRQSGKGGAFDEALSGQGAEREEEAPHPEPGDEDPAPRRLQGRGGIVRRQDDDGIPHVDVLA